MTGVLTNLCAQNSPESLAGEEFDGLTGRTGVSLDHVEVAPRGVVFDRQHLLSAVILVPVHVDRHRRIHALEAHPRSLAALFG